MTKHTTSAKWARWQWSKGLGRAHRLFTDGDLTKTACQKPRKTDDHAAVQTFAAKPSGPICSTCELFDQLHGKLVATNDLVLTPITIAAPSEPLPEPALPASVSCICGCVQNDDFRVWKIEHAAWEAAEQARKAAAFEAHLAAQKGTVAA